MISMVKAMNNVICIDPGVHGGIAFNVDEEIFVLNMPTIPTGCKSAEFTEIQVRGLYLLVEGLPDGYKIWIEKVGPRPSDTPKTSWRFSANYHCLLMALHAKRCVFKLQLPQHWQAQLGISLPSGEHNYDRRKKILKAFATDKFTKVTRIGMDKKGKWKEYKAVPTEATADALCMLWVNAGFE